MFAPPEDHEAVAKATAKEPLSMKMIAEKTKLTLGQIKLVIDEAEAMGRVEKRPKGSGFQYRVHPPEKRIEERPTE